jgi:exopolysaccharide biosynthesis polyprenyl glycosylphosphotransferase
VVASAIWVGGILGSLCLNRLYDEDTLFPGGGEVARILRAVIEASALLSVFVFITQSFYVSRSWFALTALLTCMLLGTQRLLLRAWLANKRAVGRMRRPALLISKDGAPWPDWSSTATEFEVVGNLDAPKFEDLVRDQAQQAGGRLLGRDTAVVLRARDFNNDQFWRILLLSGEAGWPAFVHSPVRSVGRDRLSVRELGGHTIVRIAPPTLRGFRAVEKRSFDVLVAAVSGLLLAPLVGVIAFAVLVSSGPPILYRQERVGLGGRTFSIIKFRSMKRNAEVSSGAVWATEGDQRRTTLGAWLRRTSLDELPQLWNVLRGDMSLVGPRPERPIFAEEFNKQLTWYRFRHRIRPGITGWAQAHGLRGDTSLDSRVQFDNWYVEHWSIALDVKIIGRTLLEICRGRNAY